MLDKAQAKSKVREYDFKEIVEIAENAERILDLFPEENRPGSKLFLDGWYLPKAYKWPGEGTKITLVRGKTRNTWFVAEIARKDVWNSSHILRLYIEDTLTSDPLENQENKTANFLDGLAKNISKHHPACYTTKVQIW